jgi:histidine triad (HIT) family protein
MTGAAQEGCLFCRIARGEIPVARIHEDDDVIAFLDIRPIREGHLLIVPKGHYDYFEVLPADLAGKVLTLAQRFAGVAKRTYNVARVGFMFTGTHIAHAHAHVVPMVENTDITSRRYIIEDVLTFRDPDVTPPDELEKVARKLRAALAET